MSITTRSPRVITLESHTTPETVGPGSYDISVGILKKKESPFPFNTTAARRTAEVPEGPGPADYNPFVPRLELPVGTSSMVSASQRKCFELSDNPSPADYGSVKRWNPNEKAKSRREPMSSRSPRSLYDKPVSDIGPADFDLRPKMNRGTVIPRSARERKPSFKTPGPASYRTENTYKRNPSPSPAFIPSKEKKEVFSSTSVGLGHTEYKFTPSPAAFGKKAKRGRFWNIPKTPGPGQYEVETRSSRHISTAPFGVRGEREWVKTNNNPSPADYQQIKVLSTSSRPHIPFSQRSPRFQEPEPQYNTGPGQYDIEVADKARRYRQTQYKSPAFMSSYDRDPYKTNKDTPGPGMYNIEDGEKRTKSKKYKTCIDGTERYKQGTFLGQKLPETPGPSDYQPTRAPRRRGYIPHTKRDNMFGSSSIAPSPDKYDLSGSLLRQSYNVTYSIGNT